MKTEQTLEKTEPTVASRLSNGSTELHLLIQRTTENYY